MLIKGVLSLHSSNSLEFLGNSVERLTFEKAILLASKYRICRYIFGRVPSQISTIELFAKIVNGFQPLTALAKGSKSEIILGSEYAFGMILFFC